MSENPNEFLSVPGMTHDLGGGFMIRRLLPFHKRRMVGPFVFLDHMGPIEIVPSAQSDIRPHPHIGLSTLTYLFEGRIIHRDHLGTVQEILPGEVNWMTAGSGIVHSERAHPEDYGKKIRMQGLQFWVALPDALEDVAPSFIHYGRSQIPEFQGAGFNARVVTGSQFGLTSPVAVASPSVFLDIRATSDTKIQIVPEQSNFQIAFYVLEGSIQYLSHTVQAGHIAVVGGLKEIELMVNRGTHFIVIGGEPFDVPRFVWWNFVSSSREKIERARKAWKENLFPLIPGDQSERIPLGE